MDNRADTRDSPSLLCHLFDAHPVTIHGVALSQQESLVDILSSVLVLWRFWGNIGDESVLALREKRASVLIATTFVLLAFIVGGKSSSLSLAAGVRHDALTLLLLLPLNEYRSAAISPDIYWSP